LPDLVKDYRGANPRVAISLRSGKSSEVLRMVLDGEVDIGIVRSLKDPGVETITLREDPLMLVCYPKNPVVMKGRVLLQEIESSPLVFYDRGLSDWTLTQGLFRRAGLLPNVALEVETIETAKRMVEQNMGLGFLPQIAILDELYQGKLSAITITDAEPLRRNLDVIHPRHRPMTREADAFLSLLRSAASAIGPRPKKRTKPLAIAKSKRTMERLKQVKQSSG
jgi:DNA-binding transcriptional LysR family regulator